MALKLSIRIEAPNVDKGIELLNDYKNLEITPLMLKKNPYCVETIRKLRRYIGNVNNWEMSKAEKNDFMEKAKKVRAGAEDIYNQFKVTFRL